MCIISSCCRISEMWFDFLKSTVMLACSASVLCTCKFLLRMAIWKMFGFRRSVLVLIAKLMIPESAVEGVILLVYSFSLWKSFESIEEIQTAPENFPLACRPYNLPTKWAWLVVFCCFERERNQKKQCWWLAERLYTSGLPTPHCKKESVCRNRLFNWWLGSEKNYGFQRKCSIPVVEPQFYWIPRAPSICYATSL